MTNTAHTWSLESTTTKHPRLCLSRGGRRYADFRIFTQDDSDAVRNLVNNANSHDSLTARVAELEAALRVAAPHVYRAYADDGCMAYQQDAEQVRAALAKE